MHYEPSELSNVSVVNFNLSRHSYSDGIYRMKVRFGFHKKKKELIGRSVTDRYTEKMKFSVVIFFLTVMILG